MRVPGIGAPRRVIEAAVTSIADFGQVIAVSRIRDSRPIGPSRRTYANATVMVETRESPLRFLASLQRLELRFGRRRRGSAWRARQIDLDIVLWSGGTWLTPELVIPHPMFRERPFVIGPAAEIAPNWRDPVTGLTLRQLAKRRAQS